MSKCTVCKQSATHLCSHCTTSTPFLVCSSLSHPLQWVAHQKFHLLGQDLTPESLHLKILRAKAMKKFYFIDEDRFIERFEIPEDDEKYVVKFEDNLVGSRKALYPLWSEYKRDLDRVYAKRIFFSKDMAVADCLGKWVPIKRLGSGMFGDVYQVCSGAGDCDYAAKITHKLTPLEIELYRKASNLNIAPFFYESFTCGNIQVLIAEMMDGNLYDLLKTYPANLDEILTQVFTLMYRLYNEAGIVHGDTKVCNYLYREGGKEIRLADYGVSFYKNDKPEAASLYNVMQTQADYFVETLVNAQYQGCDETVYDYFDIKKAPNDPNIMRDSLIRVVKAHPEWEIKSLAHVWYGGSDPTFD